jgi:hypothetical protein
METATRQYDIPPRRISMSWWKKVALFFAVGCFMFVFRWVIESLLHWEHQSILQALIMPVVLGAWFALRPLSGWVPEGGGSVIIGDDFIESRTHYNGFTLKKKCMSREKIKLILENKRGLCVMDRGKFAARMLGFIFIPASVPEYQQIKSILSGWAPLQSQG